MITRFGMNKKSLDPINDDVPFYIKQNGVYQPVEFVYVDGPSRSFYQAQNSTYRYVWMETESPVYCDYQRAPMSTMVHIDKERIISNMKSNTDFPVCFVTTHSSQFWCNEFEIHGPCQLVYKKGNNPEVWIETDSYVTMIGDNLD